jgi:hypothetical protein
MSAFSNPQVDFSWPGPPPRLIRRLGENSVPLRRLYFLDFPLLLLSVGLFTWAFPTDTMLAVSSFVGAVVGLYTLWGIVVRRGPIRIAHFFCVANTVGYGLGALNSWLTISRGSMTLADYFNRDTEAVSHAMATVLISSGILYALGELYETPVFGSNFRLRLDNRAPAFVLFGTALVIVGYATGSLGYMGVNAATSGGHLSVFAGLLGWLLPTLFAFTSLTFLEWRKGMVKRMVGFMLMIQFVLIIPSGRRSVVYYILLALITSRFSTYRPAWSLVRKLIYVAILAGVMAMGAVAFYYLRFAAWGKHHVSLLDRISLAMDLYESGNTSKANQGLAVNLQKRTFVLGYLSDLLDASMQMKPGYGINAIHEFQLVVPSFFWEDKSVVLYSEESIANTQFNFSYKDEANSLYTAGAIDFGIWGMIFYPILVWILFRTVAEFVRANLAEMISTIVIVGLLYNSLITEAGLWVHLLAVRDSLLFSIFLWFFFKVPSIALRSQQQTGILIP